MTVARRSTGVNRSTARRVLKGKVLQHYHGSIPTRTQTGRKVHTGLYRCYFCRGSFRFNRLTLEHLVPISRGGSVRDIRNLEVACQPCNNKKDNMTVDEFQIKYDIPSYLFPRRGIMEEEV